MKQFNNIKIYVSLVKSCCQLRSAAIKIVHLIAKNLRLLSLPMFSWLGLEVSTQQGLFKFTFNFVSCRN